MDEFIQDYYITACFGILKWFLLLTNLVGAKNTWSPNGTIPIDVISFASERCIEYIRFVKNIICIIQMYYTLYENRFQRSNTRGH